MDWVNSTYCGFDLKNPADQVLAKAMMKLPEDHEDITEDFVHPTDMIIEQIKEIKTIIPHKAIINFFSLTIFLIHEGSL